MARLEAWLAHARGGSFDIVIAGRIFGGRSGESPQWPEAYTFTAEDFRLQFGGGHDTVMTERDGSRHVVRQGGTERLVLIRPAGISAAPDGALVVARAAEARFGWHYYGRPQTDENWCEDWYRLQDGFVEHTVTGPTRNAVRRDFPERFPAPPGPFVRLAPLWWRRAGEAAG